MLGIPTLNIDESQQIWQISSTTVNATPRARGARGAQRTATAPYDVHRIESATNTD